MQPRAIGHFAVVRRGERVTAAVGELIVWQQMEFDLTAQARLKIAELGVDTQTAPAGHLRRDGRVAVRCNVPVVGHRHLDPALAVQPDIGRQPAGLALIGQRETQARRAQDRYAVKAQHSAFGNAFVAGEIQVQLVSRQKPGRPAGAVGRATRVGRGNRRGALFAQKVDALRCTARTDAVEAIGRVREETFERLHLELQFRTGVDVAIAVDVDVAPRSGEVVRLPVGQTVSADHQAALAELGVALGHDVHIGAGAERAGAQDDWQLARRRTARCRLQRG